MKSRYFFRKNSFTKGLLASYIALQSTAALSDIHRVDFDIDDDGLIEINDLADLNEIRNNLDGAALYGVSTGCPSSGCRGFELSRDLDFDTNGDGVFDKEDAYWNDGLGWKPLGSPENPFSAVLEGNTYSIANLYIKVEGEFEIPESHYILLTGTLRHATIHNLDLNVGLFSGGQATLIGNQNSQSQIDPCDKSGVVLSTLVLNVDSMTGNCSGGQLVGASDLNSGEVELEGPTSSGSVVITTPHDGAIWAPVDVTLESGDLGSIIEGGVVVIPENDPVALSPVEIAVPKAYSAVILQGGVPTALAYSDGGEVSIKIQHLGSEPGGNFSYSWSSNQLVPKSPLNADYFTFDPEGLNGTYKAVLTVTHSSGWENSKNILIRIEESSPKLSVAKDTDNDGLSDLAESVMDLDLDRVPDYLDKKGSKNSLPASAVGYQMQSSSRTSLALGDSAYAAGKHSSNITLEDIDKFFGENLATQNKYQFLHGIFDFIVRDVEVGMSTDIVIPLTAAIIPNSRYVKYIQGVGWIDFVEDTDNLISSAPGKLGECPEPGDSNYEPGLIEGYFCMQLTIKDGGQNDADGLENGVVVDPGAVAVSASAMPVITIEVDTLSITSFKKEDGEQVVFSFILKSDSADALVNAIALQAGGDLNETGDIGKVRVYRDSSISNGINASYHVADGYYSEDDGSLMLTFDEPYQLPVGETRFVVTYSF
jgi:hypothetical protein